MSTETVETKQSGFPVGRTILAAVTVGLGGIAAAVAHAPTRNAIARQLGRAKGELEKTWARARDAIRSFVEPAQASEEPEESPREHGLRGAEARAVAAEHARPPHFQSGPPRDGVRNVVLRRVHRHV